MQCIHDNQENVTLWVALGAEALPGAIIMSEQARCGLDCSLPLPSWPGVFVQLEVV
jgi:hypothetical protein